MPGSLRYFQGSLACFDHWPVAAAGGSPEFVLSRVPALGCPCEEGVETSFVWRLAQPAASLELLSQGQPHGTLPTTSPVSSPPQQLHFHAQPCPSTFLYPHCAQGLSWHSSPSLLCSVPNFPTPQPHAATPLLPPEEQRPGPLGYRGSMPGHLSYLYELQFGASYFLILHFCICKYWINSPSLAQSISWFQKDNEQFTHWCHELSIPSSSGASPGHNVT